MYTIPSKNVFKLTEFAQMVFRPKLIKSNLIQKKLLQFLDYSSPLIQNYFISDLCIKKDKIQQNKTSTQFNRFAQNRTVVKTFPKISYILKLSQKYLLIGNQNQIDLIQIIIDKQQGHSQAFIFTEIHWNLHLPESPITSIAINRQIKKQDRVLVIANGNKIIVFLVVQKQLTKYPTKLYEMDLKKQILKITFIKRLCLIVYFGDEFRVYVIQDINTMHTLSLLKSSLYSPELNYIQGSQYLLHTISDGFGNQVKVFFTNSNTELSNNSNSQNRTFGLYFVGIQFLPNDIRLSKLTKIYDIKSQLINSLAIYNYSQQIILINLQSQVIAIKNCLVIDNAYVNFRQKGSFIKYIQKDKQLLHFQKDKIQVYEFSLSQQFNPEKIILKSKDSIVYKRPENGSLIGVLSCQSGYGLFYQNGGDACGNLEYCFCLPYTIGITDKLWEMFPSQNQIQQLNVREFRVICDKAMKMGLSQKEAHLQMWKRSKKNTQKSFQILLMINDFEVILKELQQACMKSLRYRDVRKIIKTGAYILREKLFQQTSTLQQIITYLKYKFWILKLQAFKDIQIFKRKATQRFKQFNFQALEGPLKNIFKFNVSLIGSRNTQLSQALAWQQTNFMGQDTNKNETMDKGFVEQGIQTPRARKQLKIDIKALKFYKQTNLATFFLSQITQFLYNPLIGDHIVAIRYFIKNFTVLYRIMYAQLLFKVTNQHKFAILSLVRGFPEFLPVKKKGNAGQKSQEQMQTMWDQVNAKHLENNVFLPELQTIYNKKVVGQLQNNLWLRMNQYTYHGLICGKPEDILNFCNSTLQKQRIFQLFYSEMLQARAQLQNLLQELKKLNKLKDQKTGLKIQQIKQNQYKIKQILEYVTCNYQLLPQNLKTYCEIYYELYFKIGKYDKQIQKYQLVQFMQLSSFQLFKLYFLNQKCQKGYILDTIYNLYESKLKKGRKTFRKDLEQYFLTQELSNISDLKTILNRLNNKNKQYQMKNEKLFVMLISCLMRIFVIGAQSQVSLGQQLLIYTRDVCFNVGNISLINNLRFLNRLHKQIRILEQIKIGMSIQYIFFHGEEVLSKVIVYLIRKHVIKQIQQYQTFKTFTYLVLSSVNAFRAQIYLNQHKRFIYFSYLAQVMKQQRKLKFVLQLITDDLYLNQLFQVNSQFKQSLFCYMYQWRLSGQYVKYQLEFMQCRELTCFLDHKSYIQVIVSLLDQNNLDRRFAQLQIQYAQAFKSLGITCITYPISLDYKVPTLNQLLTHILSRTTASSNIKIDYLKTIFQVMQRMRQIFQPNVQQDLQKKKNWFLKQIYEMFFLKFIQEKKLKEAVQIIYQIEKIPNQGSYVIYPILIIDQVICHLPEKSQLVLIELISYFFHQPNKMTDVVRDLLTVEMTSQQFVQFIQNKIKTIKHQKVTNTSFLANNFLFNKQFLQKLKSSRQTTQIFEQILNNTLGHLIKSKEQFNKNKSYRIIYKILCQEPYCVSKYIFCCRSSKISMKNYRAFFSYLSQQIVFQAKSVLKFATQVLQINFLRMTRNMTMDQIIKKYQIIGLTIQVDIEQQGQSQKYKRNENILLSSIKKMKEKLIFYKQRRLQQKINNNYFIIQKQYQMKQILQNYNINNAPSHNQQQPSQLKDKSQRQTQKYRKFTYRHPDQFFEQPDIVNQLIPSRYLFRDGDDGYEVDAGDYIVRNNVVFPRDVTFDEVVKKHEIFVNNKNTRFPKQNLTKNRKKSQYYQQSVVFRKKGKQGSEFARNADLQNCWEQYEDSSNVLSIFYQNQMTKISSLLVQNTFYQQIQSHRGIQFKRRRKSQQRVQNLVRPLALNNKSSANSSSQWVLRQKTVSFGPSVSQTSQNYNQSNQRNQLAEQLIQYATANHKLNNQSPFKLEFLTKYHLNLQDCQFKSKLKQSLRVVYNNEKLLLGLRFQVVGMVVKWVGLQDFVSQYLICYKRATQVSFLNALDRKFSVMFPFEGLFCLQGTHRRKILQNNQNQKYNQTLQSILYDFLILRIRQYLNLINITQISLIIQKCLQDHKYYNEIHFQLILILSQQVINEKKSYNNNNSSACQIEQLQHKISHLIQQIDEVQFIKQRTNGLNTCLRVVCKKQS